jgi:periplasmic protein TonB
MVGQEARRQHPLLRALAWSVALHALAIGSIVLPTPSNRETFLSARLAAKLVNPHTVPPVTAQAAPTKRVPAERVATDGVAVVTGNDAQPPLATSAAGPKGPEAATPEPIAPAIPDRQGDGGLPTLNQAATLAAVRVQESLAGNFADELRRYRMAIGVAAKRFKRYPALARERGWEGTSEVLIVFAPTLTAPSVRLGKPSGHQILDREALALIDAAMREVQVPAALQASSQRVSVPIEYRLDE